MLTTVNKHLKLHHTSLFIWYTIYYIAQFRGCINFRLKSLNKRTNLTKFEKFLKVYSFIMLQFTYYYSWLFIICSIYASFQMRSLKSNKSFVAQDAILGLLAFIVVLSTNVIIANTLRKNQERIKIIIIEFRRIEGYIRQLCYCSYYLNSTQMCLISLRWLCIILNSMTSVLIKLSLILTAGIHTFHFYIISYELCYHAHLLCIFAITNLYRALNTSLCDYLRLLVRAPGKPPKFPLKLIEIEHLIQKLHFKISECAAPFLVCIYSRLFLSCVEIYAGMSCCFFATHLSTANRRKSCLMALPFIILEFLEIFTISYAADMLHMEQQRFQAQLLDFELHLARHAYKRRRIQDTRYMLVLEHELQWTSLHSKINCFSVSAYGVLFAYRSTILTFLNAMLLFTIPLLQYLVAELKKNEKMENNCRAEYIWEIFN